MRPLNEEFGIESDAAVLSGIELHHPAVDALRIELRVDRAIERVGELDALPVPADLYHLGAAIERIHGRRVSGARHDPSDAHLAGELRIEGVGDSIFVRSAS
jgi:hypothetical protein